MKKEIALVTADFYSEFELYETSDPDDLKGWVSDMVNGRFRKLDDQKHKLIASYDDMETDDAIAKATVTIWCNELVED